MPVILAGIPFGMILTLQWVADVAALSLGGEAYGLGGGTGGTIRHCGREVNNQRVHSQYEGRVYWRKEL